MENCESSLQMEWAIYGGDTERVRELLSKNEAAKEELVAFRDEIDFWVTPLELAVAQNQPDIIKVLLEAGVDLAATDEFGQQGSALARAVHHNNQAAFQLLLDWNRRHSEDPDVLIDTAAWICIAAAQWLVEMMEAVLDCKIAPIPQPALDDALFIATDPTWAGLLPDWWSITDELAGRQAAIIDMLLDAGAHPNTRHTKEDQRDWVKMRTPLLQIMRYERLGNSAKVLLRRGADPNSIDGAAAAPIHYAAAFQSVEIVQLLAQHGAHINASEENGLTPLHIAASLGRKEVADYLLEHGADPSALERHNETPLCFAAEGGYIDIVRLLVDRYKVDIHARNRMGWTALLFAMNDAVPLGKGVRGRKMIEFLLSRGADIHDTSAHGWTVLHRSIISDDVSLVEFVLQKGGRDNIEIKSLSGRQKSHLTSEFLSNKLDPKNVPVGSIPQPPWDIPVSGQTPLHWAAERCVKEVVRLLLDYGADINAQDGNGRTPLMRSIQTIQESSSLDREAICGVVGLFLDRMPDLDIKDNGGNTAKDWATKLGWEFNWVTRIDLYSSIPPLNTSITLTRRRSVPRWGRRQYSDNSVRLLKMF
ncbi:hypothetical protein MGYG_00020 [Nannizzia gypsea CBS 118893]|uniref:Uncharacterized protein n=1 Tax=Arthroderma gypseum (strain ATCC MYA-4604 / CBS 118893) TaxID=535722 RepID=E5R286_ARTGP|nr:hypothetical protein MGYG_00020 [Nannizzia gypsea CBS 118893]EFQ96976.1 hypothetical protein MGYG_00020 [Nannizzia gypsea CBS 118893]